LRRTLKEFEENSKTSIVFESNSKIIKKYLEMILKNL